VSAVERVAEVAIGGVVGLVVSLLILPGRAQDLVIEAAGRMLTIMAGAVRELFEGFTASLEQTTIRRIQDHLGETLARLNTLAPEVRHEQMARFGVAAEPGPLLRTLLRLRQDAARKADQVRCRDRGRLPARKRRSTHGAPTAAAAWRR